MTPKASERQKAVLLRQQGLSYSEIKKRITVSQASLSLWLRSVPITKQHRKRLNELARKGQGAASEARRTERLRKLALLEQEVIAETPQLLKDSFFTFGLALYWAEGSKQRPWRLSSRVCFSNSDEVLVILMRNWFSKFCGVEKERLVYRLFIHETVDSEVARKAWARALEIDENEILISLKRHVVAARHKHDDYKGLIQMTVRKSTWLNRRIHFWTIESAKKFSIKKLAFSKPASKEFNDTHVAAALP